MIQVGLRVLVTGAWHTRASAGRLLLCCENSEPYTSLRTCWVSAATSSRCNNSDMSVDP